MIQTSLFSEDDLLLIRELYAKQKELASRNKKQIDMQYLKIAERLIREEFAVPNVLKDVFSAY